MQTLLKGKTDSTSVQLFRYTLVGGAAYLVDIGTLIVAVEVFAVYYLTSAAIAFLLGLTTNYGLSILWVFSRRTSGSRVNEFLIFSAIGIAGLGLNELFIWFFTELLFFHYVVSKLFSTVFVYLWNFFARKYALFN
jgi:putative flippase GtrA